jgi:hypothetical protein
VNNVEQAVKQSPEEQLAVIKTFIAPHSIITSDDGLFYEYREFLGAVQFLQLHGDSQHFERILVDICALQARMLPHVPELKQRELLEAQDRARISYFTILKNNAVVSEKQLRAHGLEFDSAKSLVKERHDPARRKGGYARKHLFNLMVVEAFLYFNKRPDQKNTRAIRKQIADRLKNYFSPEMLGLSDGDKISRALWDFTKTQKKLTK